MRKKKRKILFVIHPKSKKILNENSLEDFINQFAGDHKFEWEKYQTTGKNDKEKLEKQIHAFYPETIISVGGDGTANMVANTIIYKNISMGIIPAGSANGLAFNLKMPNDFKDSLEKIINASPKPIDLIRINNKYHCIHLSDVGINARIVKRFSEEKSKGLYGYGKELLKELFSPKTSFEFKVKTPGISKTRKAEMLVIANASRYGTGAVINPKGIMDDGKFEIVIIKPYPWWFIFRFIAAFFTRSLHKMKYVQIITATKAEIVLSKPQDIQIDGEVQKPVKNINVEIIPGVIDLLY